MLSSLHAFVPVLNLGEVSLVKRRKSVHPILVQSTLVATGCRFKLSRRSPSWQPFRTFLEPSRPSTATGENPLWGAPRIHGELRMLGIEVAEATVGRYMGR